MNDKKAADEIYKKIMAKVDEKNKSGLGHKIGMFFMWLLLIIIVLGTFIQCTHTAGEITDIIIDNPY